MENFGYICLVSYCLSVALCEIFTVYNIPLRTEKNFEAWKHNSFFRLVLNKWNLGVIEGKNSEMKRTQELRAEC